MPYIKYLSQFLPLIKIYIPITPSSYPKPFSRPIILILLYEYKKTF